MDLGQRGGGGRTWRGGRRGNCGLGAGTFKGLLLGEKGWPHGHSR